MGMKDISAGTGSRSRLALERSSGRGGDCGYSTLDAAQSSPRASRQKSAPAPPILPSFLSLSTQS